MEKRVVITGMGIWACIGKNTEEVTQSLREGRSGIGLDPARRELGYISSLTGIVEQPNLKGVLDRRKRLCLPQQGEYAYMATAEAMRNAGMDEAYLAANEVGIIYGNDSSAAPVIEGIDIIRARRNTAMVGSGNIFQSMNSTVTMNHSTDFNETYPESAKEGEPGYSGGRHGSGQPAVVYAADVDLLSGREQFEAVLVGHSSPDGSSGGIDPDISGLTSALRIVERITIRVR